MKKWIVLWIAVGALLTGCRPKAVVPEFELIVLDTVVVRHQVPCKFQYAFTSIANADKSAALQAIQRTNILYAFDLEDFAGTPREAIDESIEQFVGYVDQMDTLARNSMHEMVMVVESDARVVDSLVVCSVGSESYTGGAHGMYSLDWHNYSLAGGHELTLADLFDEQQQEALQALIRQKLYEQFGVTGDEGLVAQGFFPDQIAATENFEITEGGIVFYYNPYDIGSFALGDVRVEISRAEMAAL